MRSVCCLSFSMSISSIVQWRTISSAASLGMMPSRPCTRASAASMSRYFCVRFSSDQTLRMGSLLKMSPKTAESMMVDGMDGALGGGCGLVPALQHVRLGDQVRFRTEISHGTATANAFGQQVQQYHRL